MYRWCQIRYCLLTRWLSCCIQVLQINPAKTDIDAFTAEDFTLTGYDPHKKIVMQMAV
jgi:thymidylate synthase